MNGLPNDVRNDPPEERAREHAPALAYLSVMDTFQLIPCEGSGTPPRDDDEPARRACTRGRHLSVGLTFPDGKTTGNDLSEARARDHAPSITCPSRTPCS